MSDVAAARHRDQATESSLLTRLTARLSEEPVTHGELERLAKTVKIRKSDPHNTNCWCSRLGAGGANSWGKEWGHSTFSKLVGQWCRKIPFTRTRFA